MNRWDQDDRHVEPSRLAAVYSSRQARKWTVLFLAWVAITGILAALHLQVLIWPIMLAVIGYVVSRILRATPPASRAGRAAETPAAARLRFNPAPGWPEPPPGWTPPRGWRPNPSWPPVPPGWEFWVPASDRGTRNRTSRPQRRNDDGWN